MIIKMKIKDVDREYKELLKVKLQTLFTLLEIDNFTSIRIITYILNALNLGFQKTPTVDLKLKLIVGDERLLVDVYLSPYLWNKPIDRFNALYSQSCLIENQVMTTLKLRFQVSDFKKTINQESLLNFKNYFETPSQKYLMLSLKESNKRLIENGNFLNALLENVPSIIYTKDLMGCYSYVNQQWEKSFNTSSKNILGKTDQEYFGQDIGQKNHLEDSSVIDEEVLYKSEQDIITSQGLKTFLFIKVPMQEDNHTVGLCSIGTDITEHKELEKVLNSEKKRAEELMNTKSIFLANMSHEIRTPMNAILGMTYLMKQTTLDEQQTDYISKIQLSSNHLLSLINEILDLSKLESDMLKIDAVEFDLVGLIHETVQLIETQCNEKNIELRIELDNSLNPYYIGDPLRIRQMLLNYISNAIKFTEYGTIKIQFLNLEENVEDSLIKVMVTDTGIGLAEEETKKIFKPFEQGDGSVTRRFGGTGLGLAICKKLANLMGGNVGVESELGVGSSFWFTIKLKNVFIERNIPLVADDSEEFNPTCISDLSQNKPILLVEDNEMNREVMVGIFNHLNIIFDTAENGQIAIDKVINNQYSLILMDVQMPVMDGLTATKHIRTIKELENIPIIAMTANVMKEDQEKCFSAGMDDYISKPVNPSELFKIICKWINKKSK